MKKKRGGFEMKNCKCTHQESSHAPMSLQNPEVKGKYNGECCAMWRSRETSKIVSCKCMKYEGDLK